LSESARKVSDGRATYTRLTHRLLLLLLARDRDSRGRDGADRGAVFGADLRAASAANHAAGLPAPVPDVAVPDSGAGGRDRLVVCARGPVSVPADCAGGAGG